MVDRLIFERFSISNGGLLFLVSNSGVHDSNPSGTICSLPDKLPGREGEGEGAGGGVRAMSGSVFDLYYQS